MVIYENRLIKEKSPYLLQHAHNPVDWFPWCKEAFDKAKAENKPIFLSIGYSSCHWCHVMEHESFEDDEVASVLNKYFVSIKVDREERPDIDSVYMSVCQSLTGHGGWPLTIIMTPDQKPFFAATYLPKENNYGLTGIINLLNDIAEMWRNSKTELLESGENIVKHINKNYDYSVPGSPDKNIMHNAYKLFSRSFDKRYGGFGNAPKFPVPHNLMFLMRYAQNEKITAASDMVWLTLDCMYRGGIFDHIGGGFSRYSTDDKWLVPHFEKMLYDNALLVMTYLGAYGYTGNDLYAEIAEKTINYVLSELTDPDGGFYCGQDADSDGVEGKYYVFTADEIKNKLGDQNGNIFCRWFGVTDTGNFEGKNILNLLANNNYKTKNPFIEECLKQLYDYRLKRTKLHKDDKILTSWNSLMIAALAKAYVILNDDKYLSAALKAERFISENLIINNRLKIRYRDGESAGEGTIDDYAFYIWSLLNIYDVTFNTDYLVKALRYTKVMCEQFFDFENGGFYLYSKDAEQLISRPKELYDGAIPSGNSVAAYVLSKLAKLTGETQWIHYSDKQMRFIAGNIAEYPSGHSFSLLALMNVLYTTHELICLSPSQLDLDEIRKITAMKPDISVLVINKENHGNIQVIAPFTKNYSLPDQGAVFYLCSGNTCSAPVTDVDKLKFQ